MAPSYEQDLNELKTLPRPVYGHAQALPNRVLGYRHSHSWIQLSYATSGVIEVQTSIGLFIAPPQRAVWIPAGVEHRVKCVSDTQIRSLYIDPAAIDWSWPTCRVLAVDPLLRELIQRFSELPVAYDKQGPDGRLAAVLLDQLANAPETGLMLPLPQDPRLQELCQSLQRRPQSRERLGQWASRLAVSEKTLSRLFRRQTGLSFRLWRQRLRLLAALPLLQDGQRVTDVALACGYASTSAFILAFREHFGTTPGEFFNTEPTAQGSR